MESHKCYEEPPVQAPGISTSIFFLLGVRDSSGLGSGNSVKEQIFQEKSCPNLEPTVFTERVKVVKNYVFFTMIFLIYYNTIEL